MLVISCYIMVLFLFFGTCLFCYSYLHLLSRKLKYIYNFMLYMRFLTDFIYGRLQEKYARCAAVR